jgi:hypothetical protein
MRSAIVGEGRGVARAARRVYRMITCLTFYQHLDRFGARRLRRLHHRDATLTVRGAINGTVQSIRSVSCNDCAIPYTLELFELECLCVLQPASNYWHGFCSMKVIRVAKFVISSTTQSTPQSEVKRK